MREFISVSLERVKMYWRREKRLKGRMNIENFDTDLTAEILSRLPLKTLLRCRSVCKLWRSLINSHPIVTSRCRQGYSSGFFVYGVFWGEEEACEDKLAFISNLEEDMTSSYVDAGFCLSGRYQSNVVTRPLSICNGLFFCSSHNTLLRFSEDDDFYIFNPETREHITIPEFTAEETYYVISGLAFDNSNGRGNIASYKIVMAALKPRLQFKVYSSETRAWREPSPSLLAKGRRYRRLQNHPPRSVFYCGTLYWLVDVDCLLTFNTESEKSRWVHTPNGGDLKMVYGYPMARLVEWEGEPYYVRIAATLRLDVWKMCSCSAGADVTWVSLYSIEGFIPSIFQDLSTYFRIPNWFMIFPVAIDNEGDRIMFSTYGCKMILYDLRTKRVLQPFINHCPKRKLAYAESTGPWYMHYTPTTKFLTK